MRGEGERENNVRAYPEVMKKKQRTKMLVQSTFDLYVNQAMRACCSADADTIRALKYPTLAIPCICIKNSGVQRLFISIAYYLVRIAYRNGMH